MKYCSYCGSQIADHAVYCEHCGARAGEPPAPPSYTAPQRPDDTLPIVVKVFLILGCISLGWAMIPLCWCIPITVSIFRKLNANEPIGDGLKVCTLLFVNLVAGILLLCMNDS